MAYEQITQEFNLAVDLDRLNSLARQSIDHWFSDSDVSEIELIILLSSYQGNLDSVIQENKNYQSRFNSLVEYPYINLAHCAAFMGNTALLAAIKKTKPDLISKQTLNQQTTAHYALRGQHSASIRWLVDNDYHYLFNEGDALPAFIAEIQYLNREGLEILIASLTETVVNNEYNDGQQLVHYAALSNNIEILDYIRRHYPQQYSQATPSGQTIVHYALQSQGSLLAFQTILEQTIGFFATNLHSCFSHLISNPASFELLEQRINQLSKKEQQTILNSIKNTILQEIENKNEINNLFSMTQLARKLNIKIPKLSAMIFEHLYKNIKQQERFIDLLSKIDQLALEDKADILAQKNRDGWNLFFIVINNTREITSNALERINRLLKMISTLKEKDQIIALTQVTKGGWNVFIVASGNKPIEVLPLLLEAINQLPDEKEQTTATVLTQTNEYGSNVLTQALMFQPTSVLPLIINAINQLSQEHQATILTQQIKTSGLNALMLAVCKDSNSDAVSALLNIISALDLDTRSNILRQKNHEQKNALEIAQEKNHLETAMKIQQFMKEQRAQKHLAFIKADVIPFRLIGPQFSYCAKKSTQKAAYQNLTNEMKTNKNQTVSLAFILQQFYDKTQQRLNPGDTLEKIFKVLFLDCKKLPKATINQALNTVSISLFSSNKNPQQSLNKPCWQVFYQEFLKRNASSIHELAQDLKDRYEQHLFPVVTKIEDNPTIVPDQRYTIDNLSSIEKSKPCDSALDLQMQL